MNNVHPTIGNLLASILRMPPAKVQPCDNCGPGERAGCDSAERRGGVVMKEEK